MKKQDAFSQCHPAANALFFALVFSFTMLLMHPFFLAVSLLSALLYLRDLTGRGGLRSALPYLLPTLAAALIFNLLFNRSGATVLARLPSGSPLTLESLLYGLAAAAMLAAALLWFSCWSVVLSADKFIFLFGKAAPALSLILSSLLNPL